MSMASFMSSSSSSSFSVPIRGWTYDVFLSFRGEDTRNNFIDHLHTTLVQKGICVFKDEEMLPRGNPISLELLKAIEESRFAVVVFSENYASSSWCLDELAKIMECQDRIGQKVLPVFYHVDPSDLRKQKGDLATTFQKHEQKFSEEMVKVSKWRKALAAAANLSGWHISPVNGGESSFINKIVQEIYSDIQSRRMENDLIGIESHIHKLNFLLGMEETHEVRMIGIYGMGGIGKTTIARALFRRISSKFEGSSFARGVGKNNKRDICTLQKNILKDITQHDYMIRDPEDGAELMQTRFCDKKVLLVLDDVDDVTQLEFLAATREWFGAGSRIIITTRDEHLLWDTNAKYKPAILPMDQATKLFSRHAFRKNSPPEGYEELSNRAIRYTGCLPLALKVLGSFFHGREAGLWESALNRLAKTPNIKIFETLKISYDGLEVSEQKIFLDIACFFKGRDKEHVTRVLDTFDYDPVIGISVLIEKSMLTLSNGRIDMHDLVHEMGLKIVRENYPNSRLWVHDEIHDFITKNAKLEVIEAIVVPFDILGRDVGQDMFRGKKGLSDDVFENMKNLRLLQIRSNFTSCEPTFESTTELRWFCWNEYPFFSLRVANMCKLVGLEIHEGRIEHLWMGQKGMPCLKVINFRHLNYLERFPDVSGAPNIERLTLAYCLNLVEVDKSVGNLRKLAYLDMNGCEKLKCLPSLIDMPLLETLKLFFCGELEIFPDVTSRLEKLSSIDLTGCINLKIIPRSIGKLKGLTSLVLCECWGLKILPDELGRIEKLEEVRLGSSHSAFFKWEMESVNYHSLAKSRFLRKLDLSWRQIEEQDFPDNLDAFPSLEELNLSGNSKLVELPASISRLSCLKRLGLNDCGKLQSIQGLPSQIQVLEACNCQALRTIEDLTEKYALLHKIFLADCETLLENQENEIYLDKMLQQSFLKACVAGDRQLSIWIPERKIPSWFKEQQLYGVRIAMKLPPKWNITIMGFTICVVFEDGCNGFNKGTISIFYIPFSVFYQQIHKSFERDDWSLFDEAGGRSIEIDLKTSLPVDRWGAHIVFKEDMKSIQQIRTCISNDPVKNSVSCDRFFYEIVFRDRRIGM